MTPRGISEADYAACVNNLGLLEGEEVRLQYACLRPIAENSIWAGPHLENKVGLLVFTNDNMIFMQREKGADYSQAIRVPLESINGVATGGGFPRGLTVTVGVGGASQTHKFILAPFVPSEGEPVLKGDSATVRARTDIGNTLTQVREEKKRQAVEALSKGTTPALIFCKYCGTKNKSDQPKCSSCGATLG